MLYSWGSVSGIETSLSGTISTVVWVVTLIVLAGRCDSSRTGKSWRFLEGSASSRDCCVLLTFRGVLHCNLGPWFFFMYLSAASFRRLTLAGSLLLEYTRMEHSCTILAFIRHYFGDDFSFNNVNNNNDIKSYRPCYAMLNQQRVLNFEQLANKQLLDESLFWQSVASDSSKLSFSWTFLGLSMVLTNGKSITSEEGDVNIARKEKN